MEALMNYKSQLFLGALVLLLGSGSAYTHPCGECSGKNSEKCLKKVKECLQNFDLCGQAAITSEEFDACDSSYQRCFFKAEREAGCPVTRNSSTQK